MADINIEEVLKKLSIAEKVDLLAGVDFWHTKGFPAHGVPSLRFSDGPNGVRGTRFFNGIPAACFPCGTALGATFNLPLLEEAGCKMGAEAKAKGAHVILGPTINMQRSPLGGRGFESLGEDPVLAGLGAAALVRGIQATGVQATVKHFVCNDQEHRRNASQSIVTARALREVYALPFQLALRDARPAAVMTAYNGVNGTYCSESRELLEALLRREWGFDGLVMSDWWGTYSVTEAALAGLDLEMPGPTRFRGGALRFNVLTDKVRGHVLDERARNVLRLVKRCAASGVPEGAEERTENTPETAALLRKIAGEGIVLLKNEGGILPLKKDKTTVVIGPNAKVATYHGGGSAGLAAYYAVTPYDGIAAKLGHAPPHTVGAHSHKMLPLLGTLLRTPAGKPGMRMRAYKEPPSAAERTCRDEVTVTQTDVNLVDYYNPDLTSALFYADFEGDLTPDEDCTFEFGVVVGGTAALLVDGAVVVDNETAQRQGGHFSGGTVEEKGRLALRAGRTYRVLVRFASAPASKLGGMSGRGYLRVGGSRVIDADAEIARAVALARAAEQVVVCAGLNADWESEGADRASMGLPGRLDELVGAVAAANPAGVVVVVQSGTPVAMPWLGAVAGVAQAWYGGNETGNAVADVLFGDACPSGKLPLSFPRRVEDNPAFLNIRTEGGRVLYGEDVYIGYRYYERLGREVLFPFGFGLSYTSFDFGDLKVEEEGGKLKVSVRVENTGSVTGAEVVQVYVAPKQQAKVGRPVKELKGFAKVELVPGEGKEVLVEIETKYAASYWDEERDQWIAEGGDYEVIVSNSSDLGAAKVVRGGFTVPETFWWTGL